jgi:hypothetical protein
MADGSNGEWLTTTVDGICHPTFSHQPSATSRVLRSDHSHLQRSDDPSTAHQSHQEQYDGDDQQYVNEVSQRVAAHHSEQPQHNQNDRDGFQHSSPPILKAALLLRKCNMNAVLCRSVRFVVIALFALFLAVSAAAQPSPAGAPSKPAQADEHRALDTVEFLAGAALGLGVHEGGHLIFDAVFDARPRIEGVHFGPVPFFAIAHRNDLSPRREFTISSAGFWVQEASSEWLLTRRPALRKEHASLAKGLLAFNVFNSIGYAVVAFVRAGPPERDTRGMAASIGVDERVIGAVVLAPALLDAYRYFRPDARWAKWGSRSAKLGMVLLVLKKQ